MGEGNDESPKREDESPKKRGHGRFVTLWPLLSVINGGCLTVTLSIRRFLWLVVLEQFALLGISPWCVGFLPDVNHFHRTAARGSTFLSSDDASAAVTQFLWVQGFRPWAEDYKGLQFLHECLRCHSLDAAAMVLEVFEYLGSWNESIQMKVVWREVYLCPVLDPLELQKKIVTEIRTRKGMNPEPYDAKYYSGL